ncbi:MAG: hypothetical protein ACI4JQ_07270 [Ruminococcus sp.]
MEKIKFIVVNGLITRIHRTDWDEDMLSALEMYRGFIGIHFAETAWDSLCSLCIL